MIPTTATVPIPTDIPPAIADDAYAVAVGMITLVSFLEN